LHNNEKTFVTYSISKKELHRIIFNEADQNPAGIEVAKRMMSLWRARGMIVSMETKVMTYMYLEKGLKSLREGIVRMWFARTTQKNLPLLGQTGCS